MKKIYVAMAVLGTVLLSSCVQEKPFGDIKVGENEVAFVMQGVSTRVAGEVSPAAVRGVTIPLGKVAQGEGVFLEETIEDLNPSPATKGAPAYTSTLGELYNNMGVYADSENFGDAIFQVLDNAMYNDAGWRYNHNYDGNPWPDKNTKVDFYLRMPANGNGVTSKSWANQATTIGLTSPENGAEQQDLIFGFVNMNQTYHDSKLPAGVPVTMYHALTGIKFRNGHPNGTQTKTIITKVEMIGLVNSGTGTVASNGTVTWVLGDSKSTKEAPFYLSFADPDYTPSAKENNVDGTVNYGTEEGDSQVFNGTSWVSAAADHNLNNENGELTFWFIPQEVPDDLILKVYFKVKTPDTPDGTLIPHTIKLGELLNSTYQGAGNSGNLEWKAGQLRTYTLKPFDVDVEIEDTMSDDGTTKSGLHVANTGNVDEYVRILIMGNWYGWRPTDDQTKVEPSILVGYQYESPEAATAAGHPEDPMVLPWYREGYDLDNDPATPNVDPYGSFDNSFKLADLGDRDGAAGDWADASGGFYYTLPIGPGAGVGTIASGTSDLFAHYTLDETNIPTIYVNTPSSLDRVPAVGVHLVMEIVIQAIAVPTVTVDGETKNVWWLQAWYDATKVDKLDPAADRNAKYVTIWKRGDYGDTIYVEE